MLYAAKGMSMTVWSPDSGQTHIVLVLKLQEVPTTYSSQVHWVEIQVHMLELRHNPKSTTYLYGEAIITCAAKHIASDNHLTEIQHNTMLNTRTKTCRKCNLRYNALKYCALCLTEPAKGRWLSARQCPPKHQCQGNPPGDNELPAAHLTLLFLVGVRVCKLHLPIIIPRPSLYCAPGK